MQLNWCVLPGSVLRAAVDVGAVSDQQPYDAQPAAGAGLMQGAVPGVVSVVHVTQPALQAVQHHLLERRGHATKPVSNLVAHEPWGAISFSFRATS